MTGSKIRNALLPILVALSMALAAMSVSTAAAQPTAPGTAEDRVSDVDWLIDTIADRYAYLDESTTDLEAMRALYRQEAPAATTRNAWLHVLEDLLSNLHDNHVNLNRNVDSSPQIQPSGTDIWAEVRDGRAVVTDVLPGSPAAAAGLRPGDRITAIGDADAMAAVRNALPPAASGKIVEDFTLRTLLAGDHERVRVVTLDDGRRIVLPPYVRPESKTRVTSRLLEGDVGYVRIENSLGFADTVAAFDEAVTTFGSARGLVLDLRFPPNGGNIGVAIPILGRFVGTGGVYQRNEGDRFEGGVTLDTVEPRGPFTLDAPLVVLVGRWTGSMGVGMAIGLDALGRATVVGTPMAGLRGGTETFTLPRTGVPFGMPIFRILYPDGTPREDFVPTVLVDLAAEHGPDSVLAAGLAKLRRLEADASRASSAAEGETFAPGNEVRELDVRIGDDLHRGALSLPEGPGEETVNVGDMPADGFRTVCLEHDGAAASRDLSAEGSATIIVERSDGDYVVTLRGVGPSARFDEAYRSRHAGTIRIDDPPAYELVNVAIALTAFAAENAWVTNAESDYGATVMERFAPFAEDPFVVALDGLLRRDASNYAAIKMNALTFEMDADGVPAPSDTYFRLGATNPLRPLSAELAAFAKRTRFVDFYAKNATVYDGFVQTFEDDVDLPGMLA